MTRKCSACGYRFLSTDHRPTTVDGRAAIVDVCPECRASVSDAYIPDEWTGNGSTPQPMTDGGQPADEAKREKAERFWSQYEIPFDYGAAIKVRRSGLLRGSAGNGRAWDTVEHLHVKEAFRDGRLSRSADSYLCEPDSYVTQQAQERPVDDGLPNPITCETCLKRMERWQCDQQLDTDQEVRTDGGLSTRTLLVSSARSIAYGPAASGSDGWALRFTTEGAERVTVRLDEDAMYQLWTEVHNVPWPSTGSVGGDLRREVVARAERADAETLRAVLRLLGGER